MFLSEPHAPHLCLDSVTTFPSLCLLLPIKTVQNIQSQEPFLTHNHVLGTMLGAYAPCLIESSSQSKDIIVVILSVKTLNCWGLTPISQAYISRKRHSWKSRKKVLGLIPKYNPNTILYFYTIYSPLKCLPIFLLITLYTKYFLIHGIKNEVFWRHWFLGTQSTWEPNSVASKRHSQIVNVHALHLNVQSSYVFAQGMMNVHFSST